MEKTLENIGAGVMGRNMFGPVGGGGWGDEQWKGWWGDDPPHHNDVFILTHHPREPVEMEGGTTVPELRVRRDRAYAISYIRMLCASPSRKRLSDLRIAAL
jgi:dihydrofolate reductase